MRREEIGRRIAKQNGWVKLKNKTMHSGHMSGHNGAEEDIDSDWVNEDNAAIGEVGRGLGQKTKEAVVSEDGGNLTQIPKGAKIFFF